MKLKNKKLYFIIFSLVVFLLGGIYFYKILTPKYAKRTSQMLIVANGVHIFDVDQDKFWQVANAEFPYGWSPSGMKLLFLNKEGVWVSRYDGENPIKIFDNTEHPDDDKFPEAVWLTDDIVLVNINVEMAGSLYKIDLSNNSINKLEPPGGILIPSPNGKWWAQQYYGEYQGAQYKGVYLATLDGARIPMDVPANDKPEIFGGSQFEISPDGNRLAYPFKGNLWVADASERGLADPRVFIQSKGAEIIGGGMWSPDGTKISYPCRERPARLLCIGDAETGKEIAAWIAPQSVTGLGMWSPRSDGIVTTVNLPPLQVVFLNIATGEKKVLFDDTRLGQGYSILIIDWRLIPAP